MKDYKLIIFDLDGTLFNTFPGVKKAHLDTADKMGYERPSDEMVNGFIGPMAYWSFTHIWGFDHEKATEATKVFRDFYQSDYLYDVEFYPGIEELLKYLRSKGIKTGVATNKRIDFTVPMLAHFGYDKHFDVVAAANLENTTTKGGLIKECYEKLGINPADVLMVGDTKNDTNGAKEAGVDFCAVTFGFGYKTKEEAAEDGAVLSFDSYPEMQTAF